jgi:hypothetical protein
VTHPPRGCRKGFIGTALSFYEPLDRFPFTPRRAEVPATVVAAMSRDATLITGAYPSSQSYDRQF